MGLAPALSPDLPPFPGQELLGSLPKFKPLLEVAAAPFSSLWNLNNPNCALCPYLANG